MSVRIFEKTLRHFKVICISDGVCVCESSDGSQFRLYEGNEVTVAHEIKVGGPEFLTDKRAIEAFASGLQCVGFTEKVMQ